MSALQSLPKEKHGIYSYQDNLTAFREGFRDGIPIALGYFAVAFSLGIQAGAVGLDALQGFLLPLPVNMLPSLSSLHWAPTRKWRL